MFMVAVVPTLASLVVTPEPGAQPLPSQVPQAAAWAAAGASDSTSTTSRTRYIFFINFLSGCGVSFQIFLFFEILRPIASGLRMTGGCYLESKGTESSVPHYSVLRTAIMCNQQQGRLRIGQKYDPMSPQIPTPCHYQTGQNKFSPVIASAAKAERGNLGSRSKFIIKVWFIGSPFQVVDDICIQVIAMTEDLYEVKGGRQNPLV